jgi:Terminase large subunit, T4likevirus-type, N-terminal
VTILEALADRNLFGALPAFRDLETWGAWRVFLAAVYGLPMTEAELETFRAHTGRSTPRPGGYSEAVAIVGRQSGKSQSAALVAVFEAIRATRAEGRGTYAVLVCQDVRSALRTLFRYASEPFDEAPILRGGIVSKTADSIELENGVTIAAYSCRPHGIRGIRARVAVCDELAFFRSSENVPQDVEMLRALRPCLATTGGRLIVLSSPYAQSGALWELHRKHYGRDESSTLVWSASAPAMNPTLPADYLERMKEDDPEAFRSEVLGEFRSGVSTLLDPEVLEACVIPDRRELPPADGLSYVAFADPSGGSRDAFTVAIAHRDGERVVVDCVRAWQPPFNPTGVVAEAAELLKYYGCHSVTGDRYAAMWPVEACRSHSIEYAVAELDRSRLYLELLPLVNAGAIELPDDAKLLAELRGLEPASRYSGPGSRRSSAGVAR